MSGTPQWKVYDDTRVYVASVADASLAAALVGAAGYDGWTVKVDGRIVWREGADAIQAAESFDTAAGIMDARRDLNAQAKRDRWNR